jgi:molecular chaperone DnaK
MIKEAEQYAEADKKRREDVDKLNEADATCYQAEKMLADFSDKLTDELKGRIQTAMQETKAAFARKDAIAASEKAEALKKLLKEAGAVIYSQTPSAGPYAETKFPGDNPPPYASTGEARPSGSGPRGKVVDAEYKEEK